MRHGATGAPRMSVAWEAGGFETLGLRKIGRRRWADGMEPSARGGGVDGVWFDTAPSTGSGQALRRLWAGPSAGLRTGHFGKLRTGHFGKLRTGHFGKLRDRLTMNGFRHGASGTSHRPLRQAQDRLAMNGWGLGVRGGPLTLALDAAHGCSASGEGYRRRRLALTFFHWEREKTDAGLTSLTPRTVALPHGRRRRSGASTGRPLTLPSPPRRGIRGRPLAPALDAPTRLLSLRRGI